MLLLSEGSEVKYRVVSVRGESSKELLGLV